MKQGPQQIACVMARPFQGQMRNGLSEGFSFLNADKQAHGSEHLEEKKENTIRFSLDFGVSKKFLTGRLR